MILFLSLVELLILFTFVVISLASMIKGAVFLPSPKSKVKKMISFAEIKKGMKAADLGSGDGRIIIAMAEKGAVAHGYEINPFLVWWSRYQIKKRKLQNNAFIHWKSFWTENFVEFDVITVYGIFYIMKDLEKKLQKELPPGAKVISNGFPFPTWKKTKFEHGVYIYRKPNK